MALDPYHRNESERGANQDIYDDYKLKITL